MEAERTPTGDGYEHSRVLLRDVRADVRRVSGRFGSGTGAAHVSAAMNED